MKNFNLEIIVDSEREPRDGVDVCVHVGPQSVRAVFAGARRRPHPCGRAPHAGRLLLRHRGQRPVSAPAVRPGRQRRAHRRGRKQVLPLPPQVRCFILIYFYLSFSRNPYCLHLNPHCCLFFVSQLKISKKIQMVFRAIETRNVECLEELLERGASVSTPGSARPVAKAFRAQSAACLRLLLLHGARFDDLAYPDALDYRQL
jgi:hypothetical protein